MYKVFMNKRSSMRKKSAERAELSCRMSFEPIAGSSRPEDLLPWEWIDVARKARVRAITIANFQGEIFETTAHAVENLRRELEPDGLDFKVLYGMETMLEDGHFVHLLVQRQEGLAQLYRLLETAWQGRTERPFLRKSEISAHRTGLLVGCPGERGELYQGILEQLNDIRLEELAGFYDYLSVLPPQHYRLLSTRTLETENLILKTIAVGKRSGKPVIASGNMRVASQDRRTFRSSIAYNIRKDEDVDLDAPLPDLLYTKEMLDAFSFLEKELAEEIVIHTPNRLADSCEEIRIFPEEKGHFLPTLPDAFQTLADLCHKELQIRYSDTIPKVVRDRLEYELAVLQNNDLLCSILLISSRLVQGLQEKGYLVNARAHRLSSPHAHLYAAYLLGVTEVDPLSMHISHEALKALDMPDLEFALNVPKEYYEKCWKEAIEIFSQIFPQGTVVSCAHGVEIGWRQKASPSNRRILVPDAAELRNWMALRKIDGGYRIPFRRPEDLPNTFQLVLWPAKNLNLLRRLEELTGVPQSSINVEEAVPLLLQDQAGIPGCDKATWKLANPETMDDIIKVFSLSPPSASPHYNWETLVQEGIIPFSELIGSWDDIFRRLLDANLDPAFVYQVVQRIEHGKGLNKDYTSILNEHGVPEWFIHSCNEIMHLHPKAHWAAIDAIPALKAAWYKAHYPKEYAQTYFEVYMQ